MTLFGAADLETAADGGPVPQPRVGHRLHRLELLNWGTFDSRVWAFAPEGADSLLTGDIGSGKSTVVDALTTLLVPPQRIAFNRAAGADTRERDLRSYVLGHHKSERNEATGRTLPVGLRRGPTFSVLLAVFGNEGYDTRTSLAAVFWLAEAQEGQPERFYVTAERALSIAGDLTGFGGDPGALRKRLTASGAVVHDSYRPYGERFRKLLGIPSPQALELFAQTVSMKAVSNLTDFVRSHMLEPFDARRWVDTLVAHFDSLSKAHEAVVAARTQVEQLDPLLGTASTYEQLTERIVALDRQRTVLPAFVADRTVAHLETEVARADRRLASLATEKESLDGDLRQAAEEKAAAERAMEGHGGARLREIDREVEHLEGELTRRQARAVTHTADLETLGLAPVTHAESFSLRRTELAQVGADLAREEARLREDTDDLAVASSRLGEEERALNAELRAARDRRVNIPVAQLDLRSRLLTATGLAEADLPFAGELVQVRPEHRDWEGAAERVLRGLALSLLVPERHYRGVSDWIEREHLRGRLVYYLVPARYGLAAAPRSTHPLSDVVEVKDGPLAGWLRAEVAVRADLERVETMADFRQTDRAVTRSGQLKGGRSRHEKDDRFRIDDRRHFVLGWSAEARIDALLDAATALAVQRQDVTARSTGLAAREKQLRSRGVALDRAVGVAGFVEVDWASVAQRIDQLHAEHTRLTSASGELSRLQEVRDDAAERERTGTQQRDDVVAAIGSTGNERERALAGVRARRELAAAAAVLPDRVREDLVARVPAPEPADVTGWDAWEKATGLVLTGEHDAAATRRTAVDNRLTAAMRTFRQTWPLLTQELDDTAASIGGYRELQQRLAQDDLPRFEAEFQALLRTNAIRDVAGFRAELRKQEELIGERIDRINQSLRGIDYNPGRHIRLETERTPNQEVRTFQADLLACTDDTLSGPENPDGAYSEAKFHQVRALVERFRGREGSTEADKVWTARVTDVRNWVVFSAVERWHDTGEAHETYTDSGGKSGGQKEKLAYTVLAASLAYQFKLDWAASRSRTFQMAMIDEAFGRGSDESTRYALALFRRLGLQLVVVTPLQKIHTIEPAVSAVGFVDNPTGAGSRMHTLTVQEYRTGRAAHLAARDG